MKKNRNIFRGVVAFGILPLLALVDIVLAGVLVSRLSGYELPIITACISLYVSFAIIFGVLTSVTGKKRKAESAKKGPVLGNVMYDKINYASEPAFICDENHKIVFAAEKSRLTGTVVEPEDGKQPHQITIQKHETG